MRSMTGFGSADHDGPDGRLRVQVATVNHKQCRVALRSELRDLAAEERCRRRVQEVLQRGSITVQVTWQRPAGAAQDLAGLAAQWRRLAALAEELGAPAPRLEGLLRYLPADEATTAPIPDVLWTVLDEAIDACDAMRQDEGANLQTSCLRLLDELDVLRSAIQASADGRSQRHLEQLRQRVADLIANRTTLDDDQLIRELAIYADRIDITEELDRLSSHSQQLRQLLTGDTSAGKRIEFLLQECGREMNTIGSKANDATLAQLVVDGKSLLDQLREQAANVL